MTRSQRLDPLLRVVQQRQDDAARQLAERDRAQAEQEQRGKPAWLHRGAPAGAA